MIIKYIKLKKSEFRSIKHVYDISKCIFISFFTLGLASLNLYAEPAPPDTKANTADIDSTHAKSNDIYFKKISDTTKLNDIETFTVSPSPQNRLLAPNESLKLILQTKDGVSITLDLSTNLDLNYDNQDTSAYEAKKKLQTYFYYIELFLKKKKENITNGYSESSAIKGATDFASEFLKKSHIRELFGITALMLGDESDENLEKIYKTLIILRHSEVNTAKTAIKIAIGNSVQTYKSTKYTKTSFLAFDPNLKKMTFNNLTSTENNNYKIVFDFNNNPPELLREVYK